MLRERFNDALKQAMRDKDALTVSTVRLILARLKERDIEARPKGNAEGIADPDIQQMMQGMIKQRRESIELYEKGGRPELAEKERGEIAIIERFLPQGALRCRDGSRDQGDDCRDRRRERQGHGQGHGGAQGEICRPARSVEGESTGEEAAELRRASTPRAFDAWMRRVTLGCSRREGGRSLTAES